MLLNDDFLLGTDMAKKLFHNHAKNMPIIDFHCHLNPQEIYEDLRFASITEVWLKGDHYKWRLMRANGVPENLITGDGDDFAKFYAWAGTVEKALGNPLYVWTHLELRRFFDIDLVLSRETAREIYDRANAQLATAGFTRRSLIRSSNVTAICTTDDPADDLHWHELLKTEKAFTVVPAFRPDKAINIHAAGYADYLVILGASAGVKIGTFADIVVALSARVDFFHSMGARLSDHALDTVVYAESTEPELDAIVTTAIAGGALSNTQIAQYRTAVLKALMRLYTAKNWTMQLHLHALRNTNRRMLDILGPDTGYDGMNDRPVAEPLAALFDSMESEDSIPRTMLYSLNPNDYLPLVTLMGSYQKDTVQKMQLGSAWWHNDTRSGMRLQLQTFADESLLSNFVGMLTDSRSFLSYPRHEYFRRILCELIGEWVELGEVPDDEALLGRMVEDISYNNAHTYFGL
ncbi:glucuronate isomerase [Cryobacterium sp. PAMC25264]|uniref:glucuronate isomerase n=1 Tax=Cryobacterium sp. PAMC25264 TaxID=2861288 RepID=UPI001C63AAA5|nr:glucuronate isomerase [Cryobacterium sp. PAMC25264]QYF72768.1 glucuronate isomerase [Cryobacterium sp. PAMC25264]